MLNLLKSNSLRMTTSIAEIGTEINSIISKSRIIPLSEQEKIDNFLDHINDLKRKLNVRIEKIGQLDNLFTQLTWHDISNKKEEKLLKTVFVKAKKFHLKALKNFAELNSIFWKKDICRAEISSYKNSLDDFEDTVLEVEQIFFSLRNDQEFNDLLNSI